MPEFKVGDRILVTHGDGEWNEEEPLYPAVIIAIREHRFGIGLEYTVMYDDQEFGWKIYQDFIPKKYHGKRGWNIYKDAIRSMRKMNRSAKEQLHDALLHDTPVDDDFVEKLHATA